MGIVQEQNLNCVRYRGGDEMRRYFKIFEDVMNLHAAKDGGRKTLRKIMTIGIGVSIFSLGIILGAVIFDLKSVWTFQPDLAKFGAVGDFLGGVLNPVLAFLVLLVLLGTTRLQKEELHETRKELRETREAAQQANLENAFFQLFKLFQQKLQTISVELRDGGKIYTGTKAFEALGLEMVRSFKDALESKNVVLQYPDTRMLKCDALLAYYQDICSNNHADLGKYFSLLHNVLMFLSEKEKSFPPEMYASYCKIVRYSLSDFELFLILAHSLTESGKPMREYILQFELLDHWPKNTNSSYRFVPTNRDLKEFWEDLVSYTYLKKLWEEFD